MACGLVLEGPAGVSGYLGALEDIGPTVTDSGIRSRVLFDDQRQRTAADDHQGEPGHESVIQRRYMSM